MKVTNDGKELYPISTVVRVTGFPSGSEYEGNAKVPIRVTVTVTEVEDAVPNTGA